MAPSSTGGVFVSGLFETIGTGALPRWRMAEIDAAGAVTPWVAATRPDQVSLFAAGDAGSLVVVSSLTDTYRGRVWRRSILRRAHCCRGRRP
jgi:hypothetical protein